MDGKVHVSVSDDGVGIDAAFLPHVFELFTQAKRAPDRSQGGLGIGLALVKSLVEMHGGEVWAASAGPGRGSCFVFTLPVAPVPADPRQPDVDAPGADVARGPLRVMVVDDNVDAAETLSMLLQLQGYEVRTAADADGALATAASFAADIYILDIGLPGVDGYELARLLRADPSVPPATYIALTGYGQERDRERSRDAGFELHLVKPVEPTMLQDFLHRHPRASAAAAVSPR
jgi:CheY-like chemotaxis protein